MTIDPDELLPDDETARILHQKRQTLTAWRHEQRGPAWVKVGRRVFYRRADINAWLGAQHRQPEAA